MSKRKRYTEEERKKIFNVFKNHPDKQTRIELTKKYNSSYDSLYAVYWNMQRQVVSNNEKESISQKEERKSKEIKVTHISKAPSTASIKINNATVEIYVNKFVIDNVKIEV